MRIPHVPTFLLYLASWIGVLGFLASAAVHALTFTEAALSDGVFVLHGGVFVAFGPVVFGVLHQIRAEGVDPQNSRASSAAMMRLGRSVPTPQLALFGVLFAYAMVNFVLEFAAFGDGDQTMIRGFSGHWMVFYAGSAVVGRRLLALREEADARGPDAGR